MGSVWTSSIGYLDFQPRGGTGGTERFEGGRSLYSCSGITALWSHPELAAYYLYEDHSSCQAVLSLYFLCIYLLQVCVTAFSLQISRAGQGYPLLHYPLSVCWNPITLLKNSPFIKLYQRTKFELAIWFLCEFLLIQTQWNIANKMEI